MNRAAAAAAASEGDVFDDNPVNEGVMQGEQQGPRSSSRNGSSQKKHSQRKRRKRPLIVVCCHAIYLPSSGSSSSTAAAPPLRPEEARAEENWLLADFQRGDAARGKEGEHLTFLRHIERAREIAASPPSSGAASEDEAAAGVVIFSGGATKQPTTGKSEAQGYMDAMLALYGSPQASQQGDERDDEPLHLLEEHATDSYQNILFSLLTHRASQGDWPSSLTVVTHRFKAARVLQHLRALKWPAQLSRVEGVDPPFADEAERQQVEASEAKCREQWEGDMYGVRSPLADKRVARGWKPFGKEMLDGMASGDEAVKRLLEGDGGGNPAAVFPGRLPWEEGGPEG